jgi:lipopolysaccharide export system protein LptC
MAVARHWDRHSRLVFWLKILLPLTAIVILSTLFMVSHNIRPEDAIPYANVDIATRIKEPRLTAPDFAGMTDDGAALSLTATEVRLGTADGNNPGLINDLNGLLETPDGASTTLEAKLAHLDATAHMALLSGGVVMTNSTGYRIETAGLQVALDQTSLDSDGTIEAKGPVGQITAGSIHLGLQGTNYVLLFKDGVRLIYLPTKQVTGD